MTAALKLKCVSESIYQECWVVGCPDRCWCWSCCWWECGWRSCWLVFAGSAVSLLASIWLFCWRTTPAGTEKVSHKSCLNKLLHTIIKAKISAHLYSCFWEVDFRCKSFSRKNIGIVGSFKLWNQCEHDKLFSGPQPDEKHGISLCFSLSNQ